mmetsp:Transcript_18547/g.26102  ORF Transcript_18547/g.26102 Transcript_18547/m.26102 type:complete len:212 (+) Transcript_18547:40-675(+)
MKTTDAVPSDGLDGIGLNNNTSKKQQERDLELNLSNTFFKQSQGRRDTFREEKQLRSNTARNLPACNTASLFVGNLHPRISEPHIQKLFQRYGNISRIHFVRHRNTDGTRMHAAPHKGYAFVEFTQVDSARLAMSKIDGQILLERKLHVRPSRGNSDNIEGKAGISGKEGFETSTLNVDDERLIRRKKVEVDTKISAVKKAIEEAKRKRIS